MSDPVCGDNLSEERWPGGPVVVSRHPSWALAKRDSAVDADRAARKLPELPRMVKFYTEVEREPKQTR